MTTLYEYNDTPDAPANFATYGVVWVAQPITIGTTGPNETHTISAVDILLYRVGSPGTVTVSIRATDGEGKPTGADLSTGTTDGNTLTTNSDGEWREITMSAFEMQKDTKYAIVTRAINGDGSNKIMIKYESGDLYIGGDFTYSSNSGSTWSIFAAFDTFFKTYGYTGAMTVNPGYWGVK